MSIKEVNGKFLVLNASGQEVGYAFSRAKAEKIHAKKVGGAAKAAPRDAAKPRRQAAKRVLTPQPRRQRAPAAQAAKLDNGLYVVGGTLQKGTVVFGGVVRGRWVEDSRGRTIGNRVPAEAGDSPDVYFWRHGKLVSAGYVLGKSVPTVVFASPRPSTVPHPSLGYGYPYIADHKNGEWVSREPLASMRRGKIVHVKTFSSVEEFARAALEDAKIEGT